MSLTLTQMQTLLQRYGFDSSDPLTSILNSAMHEVEGAFDWPFLEEGPVSLVVQPGVNSISLPSDAGKVIYVYDATNLAKVRYWERHKFRSLIQDTTEAGLVEVFTLVGTTTVQVWRVPLTATTFEVLYQGVTPDLVNPSDTPTTGSNVWPSIMHFPIVQRAASIMLQMENEEDRAKNAQDEFDRAMQNCMRRFGERELGDMDAVEDSQGYLEDAPLGANGVGY